jgi:formylglycine-generating enzyme required for sulfatase activity
MILVEGGTFKMGSLTDSSGQGAISVHANYQVSLSGFSIGKYEVTQAEWTAVMGVNLSQHQGCGDCPVEDVSFNDIQLFLQSLNKMTGRHYLLPTSAQWEFAARGGNKTKGYKYAGSDDIDEVAWYGGEFIDSTHRVGRKHPNELGICDMSGNVEEWCSDFFDPNGPFRQGAETNPYGPSTGAGHTIRGGSWGAHPTQCGVLGSHIGYPNDRNAHVGFRLVLAP